MADVYANGLEITGQATDGKTIAAMPDVCFTPPENPATPPGVPIPYPSFGMASDTEKGTGTVFISGKTVNIKNKSDESKTSGTEAGCAAKKGVITSKNTGKKYFNSWSSDVKFEGEPVIRFSDLATHNHNSPPGNTPPWPEINKAAVPGAVEATEKCLVGEYDEIAKECNRMGGEAHHIVPDKCFRIGTRDQATDPKTRVKNAPTLNSGMAICLTPKAHDKIHQSEKDNLKALGRPGLDGLSGKALDTEKAKLQAAGTYGTAPMADIYDASDDMLDTLSPEVDSECIKTAKKAIRSQGDKFESGQIGRTSGSLPNSAAQSRMMPPRR
jgi:Domain of unknown function (DUF4150)